MKAFIVMLNLLVATHLFAKPKVWIELGSGLGGKETIHFSNNVMLESGTMFPSADLTSAMSDNPKALEYAKECNSYRLSSQLWIWIGYVGGLATMLAAFPLASNDIVSRDVAIGMFAGGFVASIISAFVSGSKIGTSRHYMYKAINQYNGAYDENKEENNESAQQSKSLELNLVLASARF